MKKILFLCLLLCSMSASAFHFGRSAGRKAEFVAYRFENEYFLILQFEDDDGDCLLMDNAIVKIKLQDGSEMRLTGFDSSQKTENYIDWRWHFTSTDNKTHFAVLPISNADVERLKIGIDMIAINTIPEVYKWKNQNRKSKIGQELYEDFKKLKDDFED